MTAEIAVLNCSAVALAADSAVTVQNASGGKVFNTVNKLFALSYNLPVGVMVYGSATLCGIPWETIIKEYRAHLGPTKFASLAEYGTSFREFVSSAKFITSAIQTESAGKAALLFYSDLVFAQIDDELHAVFEANGEISDTSIRQLVDDHASRVLQEISVGPFSLGWDEKDVSLLIQEYGDVLRQALSAVFEELPISDGAREQLLEAFGQFICRDFFSPMLSGIVIAGFGEDEVFPGFIALEFDGVLLGRPKYRIETEVFTSPTNSAIVRPFAQREMVDLFMKGVDPQYSNMIERTLAQFVDGLPEVVTTAVGATGEKAASIRRMVATGVDRLRASFQEEMVRYSMERHISPIVDAVSALPKDELGAMAEALVSLTSFKRRVTLDAETVGGAIDVAVISKGDGLIWLKRKHYFDSRSNPQYFARFTSQGLDG